ncbi:hypothetical protein BBJ28_00014177 [Nothophytophthora sp. Chile5]|nr:hypothetical protein BBJ28_00014177 [Nothophytophthora sp. Chile5]
MPSCAQVLRWAKYKSLAFPTGFLAFVSYPVFLYGDASRTGNVTITMTDGVQVSQSTLYGSEGLQSKYATKYETFLDIKAGTGKATRARKRLMTTYALSPATSNVSQAMSDVLWPTLQMLVPAYWARRARTPVTRSSTITKRS